MNKDEVLKRAFGLFGKDRADTLEKCARSVNGEIYEIRAYKDSGIAFDTSQGLLFCLENGSAASYPCGGMIKPTAEELYGVVSASAGNSLFLKESELKKGYLTKDGIRVGVCGFSDKGAMFSQGVSSVNVRIPCIAPLLEPEKSVISLLESGKGLLIAGPPACGKTTFLKKCAVALAGGRLGRFYKTAIIDERDEFFESLAGVRGVLTADVVRGRGKLSGIETALRLLSPEYIICDEAGDVNEAKMMLEGMNSGVRFLASMHAADLTELKRRSQFGLLWESGVFGSAVILSGEKKGQISKVLKKGDDQP